MSTSRVWPHGRTLGEPEEGTWTRQLCVLWAHVTHRPERALNGCTQTLCGNGASRSLADSLPLALPSSQTPYLALVAASSAAPAAADASALVFSSE